MIITIIQSWDYTSIHFPGMDPVAKRLVWDVLSKLRNDGKCIVLTSHNMEECEALCTSLAIMVNGNFKCFGSVQHLKSKFSAGYTLTIKIKKSSESTDSEPVDTSAVENFIKKNFPRVKLMEKHQELIAFSIPDTSVPLSRVFGIMEHAKSQNLNIEDYSIGQSSLDQVRSVMYLPSIIDFINKTLHITHQLLNSYHFFRNSTRNSLNIVRYYLMH